MHEAKWTWMLQKTSTGLSSTALQYSAVGSMGFGTTNMMDKGRLKHALSLSLSLPPSVWKIVACKSYNAMLP